MNIAVERAIADDCPVVTDVFRCQKDPSLGLWDEVADQHRLSVEPSNGLASIYPIHHANGVADVVYCKRDRGVGTLDGAELLRLAILPTDGSLALGTIP